MRSTTRRAALALSLALAVPGPLPARAAAPGDVLQASRRSGRIAVDGRLEERTWGAATPHDGFVQLFPAEGAAPSERTEVRVLYDDRALFVGVTAHDRSPGEVVRPLGRRDSVPFSDQVTLVLDSMQDGRSAYVFTVSASGVLADGLLGEDDQVQLEWDAAWEGAAAATAEGWSAELAIPLAALRFKDRPSVAFGVAVKRIVARRHEEVATVLIPRNARSQASRLGRVEGLAGIHPVRDLEITPYTAARLALRPRFDDGARRDNPRLLDPVGNLGVDVRASLGSALALQGTVNPDFGQVEADQLVQNLSTFELQFPEKRPFFTQGMDLFRPVAPNYRPVPHQLFYSRRIGLDAPILAAVKLAGSATDTVQVGVLEALVSGAGSGLEDGATARDLRFDASQPLRVGPRRSLPSLAPATRNFVAGVARWRPDPTRTVGLTATSTLLAGPSCTAAESALDDDVRPARCDARAGNAVALDLGARSADAVWFARGQATGSQWLGGAPEETLADGTLLRRGDLGAGGWVSGGKMGGEPWRFEVGYAYQSPRLDLNAAGFQKTQNEQVAHLMLRHIRPSGGGPFHAYGIGLGTDQRRTTDGRLLDRGSGLLMNSEFQLRSFHWVGLNGWWNLDRWDVREIDGTGIAQRRPAEVGGELWFNTDPSKVLSVEGAVTVTRSRRRGPLAPAALVGTTLKATVRTHARLETRLDLQAERNAWRARWVDEDGAAAPGEQLLFADLVAPVLSATLRQQVVLTPALTLQAYAQLFTTYGRYGRRYGADAPDGRVSFADLGPIARGPVDANPSFREGGLNLNVVLRWEYQLGSTLFLVYTRAQEELAWPDGTLDPDPPATLRPTRLALGPTTDAFLLKWTWFWRG